MQKPFPCPIRIDIIVGSLSNRQNDEYPFEIGYESETAHLVGNTSGTLTPLFLNTVYLRLYFFSKIGYLSTRWPPHDAQHIGYVDLRASHVIMG